MYELTNYDFATAVDTLKSYTELLACKVVTSDNVGECEEIRTRINSLIKDMNNALDLNRKSYLAPFDEVAKPYLDTISSLKDVVSQFSSDILTVNKQLFRDKVMEEFLHLCTIVFPDGVIPNFDDVFDPSWYGKTKKVWSASLLTKLEKLARPEISQSFYLRVDATPSQLDALKKYLYESRINFVLDD